MRCRWPYGSSGSQEEIEAVIKSFGLDRPVWEQYLRFMQGALAGDLGNSYVFGTPALGLILERMPATMELAFAALAGQQSVEEALVVRGYDAGPFRNILQSLGLQPQINGEEATG